MVRGRMLALLVLTPTLSGCASSDRTSSGSAALSITSTHAKKVAIASLIVRNYGTYGAMGMIPPDLITDNMDNVLVLTEKIVGRYWNIRPIHSFISNEEYTALAKGSPRATYFTVKCNDQDMPILFTDKKGFTKGAIAKETAQKLCSVLSVDAIILVYSEWSIQSGKFIPTIKALTKNCITMYDMSGKHLFFGRKDTLGPHPIGGGFSGVYINEDTIDHWSEAYETGVRTVLDKYHKRLR